MTHVASETKISTHPCPGNWVPTGWAVVYYAHAATYIVQELNAGTVYVNCACISMYFYTIYGFNE